VPQCAAALDPLLTLTSGFSRDDAWGFRACEPTRNIISSMALVLLKTGIVHPGDPDAEQGATQPTVDPEQMATAQKLLLFWRKPAVSRVAGRVERETLAGIASRWRRVRRGAGRST
jgi:hypothetical protein